MAGGNTLQKRFALLYGGTGFFMLLFGVAMIGKDEFLPPELIAIVGAAMLLYALLALIPTGRVRQRLRR